MVYLLHPVRLIESYDYILLCLNAYNYSSLIECFLLQKIQYSLLNKTCQFGAIPQKRKCLVHLQKDPRSTDVLHYCIDLELQDLVFCRMIAMFDKQEQVPERRPDISLRHHTALGNRTIIIFLDQED